MIPEEVLAVVFLDLNKEGVMSFESPLCHFGYDSADAERIWPGPVDEGNGVIREQNAIGVDDPRERIFLESAVIDFMNAKLTGREPDPKDLPTIKRVVGKYITKKAS